MSLRSLALVALVSACGGGTSNRPIVIGPTHISSTIGHGTAQLSGSWQVQSEIGAGTIDITPVKDEVYSLATRKDATGNLIAHGVAIAEGSKIYVAWSSDEHGTATPDGIPHGVKLGVFAFKPGGVWEAVWRPFFDAATGTLGKEKPPTQLAPHYMAQYSGRLQSLYDKTSKQTYLNVDRTADNRFYVTFAGDVAEIGTGMLDGDTLVTSTIHEVEPLSGSVIGVGLYDVTGDRIQGKVGWMQTKDTARPDTSKIPPVDEFWTRAGATPAAAGPAPTAAQCGAMADHLITLITGEGLLPADQAATVRTILATRCEQDKWALAALDCINGVKSMKEEERCDHSLTSEQTKALDRDLEPVEKAVEAKKAPPAAPPSK